MRISSILLLFCVLLALASAARLAQRQPRGQPYGARRQAARIHIPDHIQSVLDHADATHHRFYPDWKYEGFKTPHDPQPVENTHRRGTGPHDLFLFNESTPNPHMANRSLPYPDNLKYLLNMFEQGWGLPRSYNDVLPSGEVYWGSKTYLDVGAFDENGKPTELDSEIAIQERTLTRFGLNLYDAAVWEIALTLWWLYDVAYIYESNVLYTSTTGPGGGNEGMPGGITDIRADNSDFKYGPQEISGDALKTITYPGNVTHFPAKSGKPGPPTKQGPGAFYYRMIGPDYKMIDPMTGSYGNAWKFPWPNYDTTTPWNTFGIVHFNDWKPITGENVWAAILGPLQSLGIKTRNNLTNTTCGNYFRRPKLACDWKSFDTTPPPVQLAISILPALLALQEPNTGTLFHCPWGSKIFPPDPDEGANVSNENNLSSFASIDILLQILTNYTKDSSDEMLKWSLDTVTTLYNGLDKWFNAKTILSPDGELPHGDRVVPQGGHYNSSGWFPAHINDVGGLAVDCQTWGLTVMGQARMDKNFGKRAAYNLWKTTAKYAGYYKGDILCGVGYTDIVAYPNGTIPQHDIWSAEWTFGAINMAQVLSQEYRDAGDTEAADDLLKDAQTMYNQVTMPWPEGLRFPDGSYVYANKRFFIPWGWFSNPISALCSTAWSVLQDLNYDPFHWAGGNKPPLQVPPHLR